MPKLPRRFAVVSTPRPPMTERHNPPGFGSVVSTWAYAFRRPLPTLRLPTVKPYLTTSLYSAILTCNVR